MPTTHSVRVERSRDRLQDPYTCQVKTRLSDDDYARLTALARTLDVSCADIQRHALRVFLDEHVPAPAVPAPRSRGRVKFK